MMGNKNPSRNYMIEIYGSAIIEYMYEQIKWDRSINQLIKEQIKLVEGRVFTFAPPEMEREELLRDSVNGYDTEIDISATQSLGWFWEYLKNSLMQNSNRVCLLVEPLLKPSEVSEQEISLMYVLNEEVYFLLSRTAIEENETFSCHLIDVVTRPWGGFCVLTSISEDDVKALTAKSFSLKMLRTLVKRVYAMAFSGYDGQSYMVWEKTSIDCGKAKISIAHGETEP
jgi:hypothetical protein